MSDDAEKICPLCTEEMDLTDQQLKPCKCGYQICVWCWHHIIGMAEKDDSEGRCPACRTPYDKERIVEMATSNCERVVAEINAEKRQKSQKAKPKASAEMRKHLSSVRVIQRNLVYIIGLPSSLSDESLLEGKEYFGQYGKVLKVSISRPTGAAAQQASNNNTFSVYMTYAREEEAVRCIQAVHNFILEGKPLRACFGTTKYCHSWLRNMTCSNPDCLYLHDIGSQEDSFTKDEIISAYTRSRVPQIASNNFQRRSGNVLPPPADEICNSESFASKHHVVNSALSNAASQIKAAPVNSCSTGKATVLPAAASWGTRVSNCRPPATSTQHLVKQKSESLDSSSIISSVVASSKHSSPWHDDGKAPRVALGKNSSHMAGNSRQSEPSNPGIGIIPQTTVADVSIQSLDLLHTSGVSAWDDDEVTTTSAMAVESRASNMPGRPRPLFSLEPKFGGELLSSSDLPLEKILETTMTSRSSLNQASKPSAPAPKDKDGDITVNGKNRKLVDDMSLVGLKRHFSGSSDFKAPSERTASRGSTESLCSGLSSPKIDNHVLVDQGTMDRHQCSVSKFSSSTEPSTEQVVLMTVDEGSLSSDAHIIGNSPNCTSESQNHVLVAKQNQVKDVQIGSDPRVGSSDGTCLTSILPSLSPAPPIAHQTSDTSFSNGFGNSHSLINSNSRFMTSEAANSALLLVGENELISSNGHAVDDVTASSKSETISKCPDPSRTKNVNGLEISAAPDVGIVGSVGIAESGIISDILSLDFDPWDDSLSLTNSLAKLLGDSDITDGSCKLPTSRKPQNSNESRFLFAREDNQTNLMEPSFRDVALVQQQCLSSKESYGDALQNGLLPNGFCVTNDLSNRNSLFLSGRTAGGTKAKMSVPPGFSGPSRAPPPGFSLQDKYDQAYDMRSENNLLGRLSVQNQYQTHLTESTGDVELIDPAILAVGKGTVPLGTDNSGAGLMFDYPAQLSTSRSDPRLQLLMHQAMSAQQNPRFSDHLGLRFNDSYISSRHLAQNHNSVSPFVQMSIEQSRNPHILSSQWGGWNDVQPGSDMAMAEILRNDRLGFNKYFPGNEEHKFHIPSSGDLYNRTFRM